MKRRLALSLSSVLLLTLLAVVVAGPTLPDLEVQYDRENDLLSVRARQIHLNTLLQEIAQKAALSVESRKDEFLREPVSVEMKGLPLEQALTRLLREFNSAFLYSSAVAAPDETATPRLIKVIISSRKATKSLEARAPKDESTYPTKSRNGGPRAVRDGAEMLRALIEGGPEMVTGIVNTLRETAWEQEREKVVEALLHRLDHGNFPPGDGVIAALKDLAPEKAIDALVKLLHGTDPRMRVIAAALLGRLEDEKAITPLVSALTDDDALTRQAAASSLALIGGVRATDSLFQAYVAGGNRVRHPVSVAIASHGDEYSQKLLANLIAGGHAPGEPTAEERGITNPNLNVR